MDLETKKALLSALITDTQDDLSRNILWENYPNLMGALCEILGIEP